MKRFVIQGHVDTAGEVTTVRGAGGRHEITITFDSSFDTLVVPKGSITIDGVSLTVVDAGDSSLSVALIPHTLQETTLGELEEGAMVNLEFDIVGKYIVKTNS